MEIERQASQIAFSKWLTPIEPKVYSHDSFGFTTYFVKLARKQRKVQRLLNFYFIIVLVLSWQIEIIEVSNSKYVSN